MRARATVVILNRRTSADSQRAMTWREDGKHLAICNGNKAVALIYTGNLISGLSGGAPQLMAAKEEAK